MTRADMCTWLILSDMNNFRAQAVETGGDGRIGILVVDACNNVQIKVLL